MKTLQSESGVILITTLWILLILSVIALGFSIELHLEARLARYQVDSHTAYYLANAGVERAMVELKNDRILDQKVHTTPYDALGDCWASTEATKDIFDHVKLGDGTYTVNVIDESSKLNINKANAKMFEGLFRALEFDEDDAKFYAYAIIDFRDADSIYALDTGQTEEEFYYGSSDTTYNPDHFKNGDFISPEELLKVPGITPAILYAPRSINGDPEKQVALIDLLTVYGDGLINVNTAPLPVLTAVMISLGEEDVDNAVTISDKIIQRRLGGDGEPGTDDDQPYLSGAEVGVDMGALNPVVMSRLAGSIRTNSDIYLITSVGEVSGAKKQIEALVERKYGATPLTAEEQQLIENESKGVKEYVQIQVKRWIEF